MDFILHGYCSLYCGVCPIMLNTKARTGIGQDFRRRGHAPSSWRGVTHVAANLQSQRSTERCCRSRPLRPAHTRMGPLGDHGQDQRRPE